VAGKKKHYRFSRRNPQPRYSPYTSNVAEIKDNIFDVGATSNPTKFTKSLKNIETYIQMMNKIPDDIVKGIQKMKRPTFDRPEKPDKSKCMDSVGNYDADEYDMVKFTRKEDWKLIKTREQKYQENKASAWVLVYNQCSSKMKVKLDGTSGYEQSKNDNDVIALLTKIQGYCCKFDALNDEYMGLVGAFKNLLYFFQKPTQSNLDYVKDFLALIEVIEEYGGAGLLTHSPNMIKKELLSDNVDITKVTLD
jgi:hypothetical protein